MRSKTIPFLYETLLTMMLCREMLLSDLRRSMNPSDGPTKCLRKPVEAALHPMSSVTIASLLASTHEIGEL